jgi:hypothetical protein
MDVLTLAIAWEHDPVSSPSPDDVDSEETAMRRNIDDTDFEDRTTNVYASFGYRGSFTGNTNVVSNSWLCEKGLS